MMSNIIVHGLSIFKENEEGLCRIRSTIRTGNVLPGQELTFSTPEGTCHIFKVVSRKEGPARHITLTVRGNDRAVSDFQGGYYLYGKE